MERTLEIGEIVAYKFSDFDKGVRFKIVATKDKPEELPIGLNYAEKDYVICQVGLKIAPYIQAERIDLISFDQEGYTI